MPRSTLPGFFLLAYAWSWAWWIPTVWALRSRDLTALADVPPWALNCVLVGGYGPSVAALVLTRVQQGSQGVKTLLGRFKLWRAPWAVHLLIWLGPAAFLALAMLVAPATTAQLGEPDWSRLRLVPLAIAAAVPFGPLGEELGWRGYALPRLQHRRTALTSSLILGIFWCFWHAPLFWAPTGTTISGYAVTVPAVGMYLAATCGGSILHTWIFNHSRGSVLLAVAFHTSGNAILPMLLFPLRDRDASLAIKLLAIVPVWAVALALLWHFGAERLQLDLHRFIAPVEVVDPVDDGDTDESSQADEHGEAHH